MNSLSSWVLMLMGKLLVWQREHLLQEESKTCFESVQSASSSTEVQYRVVLVET